MLQPLLKKQVENVSRSFSFVIAQLPEPLLTEVALGYLLFRLGDNIEDTSSLSAEEKTRLLSLLLESFRDNRPMWEALRDAGAETWQDLTEGELELMGHVDRIISAFATLDPRARNDLLEQANIMFAGMADFQQAERRDGYVVLPETKDLDRYCYYVAGTVGDFLTNRFLDHMPDLDEQRRAQMLGAARSLALVLQVTNILRDIRDDHEHGHIFYPMSLFDSFDAPGLLAEDNRDQVLEAGRKMVRWLWPAIRLAEAYILAIPKKHHRLRLFCAIPYFMALRTLAVTVGNPAIFSEEPVKISRADTKRTVLQAQLTVHSDLLLTLMTRHLQSRVLQALKSHETSASPFFAAQQTI